MEGSIVVDRIHKEKFGIGLNAKTGEYVDMVKAEIVDPAKVARTALQNAASISALLLTTETLITDKPEEKKDMPQY